MPDKLLFEYAVIRIVPRVEREEFLNVGIILYCRDAKFLDCLCHLDHERMELFCQHIDCREVEEHLQSFESICRGGDNSGSIGKLDAASRFRWLTATRSTIIQTSNVHPGICANVTTTLQKLFADLVLPIK